MNRKQKDETVQISGQPQSGRRFPAERKRRNLIFWLIYFAYTSIYLARMNLSMAGPEFKAAGVLNTAQLGFLGTVFSVTYATGRLFNGMLADRAEPRLLIGTGLAVCGLANLGVGLFPPYGGILLFWGINAWAQSMLWSSVLRAINEMYRGEEELTVRLSRIVSTVAVGSVAAILISMLFLQTSGLRLVFFFPGVLTLLLGTAVFVLVPRFGKAGKAGQAQAKPDPGAQAGQGLENPFRKMAGLLRIPEVRSMLFPAAVMGLLKDNVTLWMAVYFADTYGIDVAGIAGYVLFIPLVGLAARLLFPACLKRCGGNEHRVSLLSFAGCVPASLLLVFLKVPLAAVICLSLIYALMSLVNSSLLSIFPAEFADRGCMASVSGIMDFLAYLGAGIGSAVYGSVIDRFGYGSMFASWFLLSLAILFLFMKFCRKGQKGPEG